MSHPVIHQTGSCYRIHDASILDPIPDWLFSPDGLAGRRLLTGTSTGRRQAHFFRLAEHDLVLRHYWRGGMVARLLTDVYVWTGVERSRPIREWRLLHALRRLHLPVPRPVAAQACRAGPGYRGDLVTEHIAGSRPWDDLLRDGLGSEPELWHAVGATLRRFHQAGAWHADLNVRNILVDARRDVWLIDWDRGRLMDGSVAGRDNLQRLKRSLDKHPPLARQAATGWPHLLEGYRARGE
ncbi:MAG: 3-deoxy-D-manno-octulosonic acid kinase [Ectothiorhodospiraceae bacterium]|nr:3-deoxy-D-manno-octulosonic acid kinase [Ectothiorhodospiraceae bacterium]